MKNLMKSATPIAAMLAAVALSACAPVSGPAANGVNATMKNESAQVFLAGYQPVQVAVMKNDRSIPASCTITSTKYSAAFTAPATVNIPAYINRSAVDATLTCNSEEGTKAVKYKPQNLSQKARTGSAVGVAVLCPICGAGVAVANSARSKENDIYGFTKMELEL